MTRTGGVSERIRSSLERGRDRDEIVQELIDEGLSRRSAEGFVDRELARRSEPPAREAEPAHQDEEDASGRYGLIGGSFWLSLGITVTATTYLLARPGQSYTVAYGAVVAGLLLFARSLARWLRQPTGFPWLGILIALALPPAGAASLVGFVRWRDHARPAAAEERQQADAAEQAKREAEQAKREAARTAVARREAAAADREERRRAHLARARETLRTSDRPMTLCETALDIGRSGERDFVHDLEVLFRDARHESVKICAIGALVSLGEVDRPLAVYDQWARSGDDDLKRAAIGGFGDIGPRAFPVALPHLTTALRSSNSNHRFLAVKSLEGLGPRAEPLLREAAQDPEEYVRQAAEIALKQIANAPKDPAPALTTAAAPDPPRASEATPPPGVKWELKLHEPWSTLERSGPWPSPALGADGTLYVGGPRGVYAVSQAGGLLWSREVFPAPARYLLVDDEGRLLSLDSRGALHVIDRTGGLETQLGLASGGGGGHALAPDGGLHLPVQAGRPPHALEPGTWKTRWKLAQERVAWSTPAVGREGTVFGARSDGVLRALHREGWTEWSARVGKGPAGAVSIGQDSRVLVGDEDGTLHAFSRDGRMLWSFRCDGPIAGEAVTDRDGGVYVATLAGTLFALDSAGALRWRYATGWPIPGTPALAADGTVYAGTQDGVLHAVTRDGELKWRFPAGGAVLSPTLWIDGSVVVHSADGSLRAVRDPGSGGLMSGTPWAKWGGDARNTGREPPR